MNFRGYIFMVPAKIISGVNVISELGDHIAGKGSKALIVTDQFMVKFGNAAKVEDTLKKVNIPYVIYDGANTEPTDKIVEADTAKAIGFMTTAGTGSEVTKNTIVHGMSRPIGTLFHIAHGVSVAMVKEVARFCKEVGIPSLEELLAKGNHTKEDFLAIRLTKI